MTRCIVNVAAHEQYWKYQTRLKGSLEHHGYTGEKLFWKGEYPPGSPHHSETIDGVEHVPYGFKLYAIMEAKKRGFEQVLWLDSGVHLIKSLDTVWEAIGRDGYLLVESEQILEEWCKEDVMQAHKATQEERRTLKILAGAIIGLDFTHSVAVQFFDGMWASMKAGHWKGAVSNHSKLQDHRGDEAVGALLASRLGMRATHVGEFHMADQFPSTKTAVFRSGYDMYTP